MKKKVVFWRRFTNDPILDGFLRNPEYHEFFRKCTEVFEFRFAYNRESYAGNGVFKDVLKYEMGRIIPAESEFKAEAVYQFKKVADETFDNKVPVVDTLEFKKWCSDKYAQYELLSDFMPKTFLVESQGDLMEKLSNITTQKAVIKPRSGQKGENVVVFNKDNDVPMLNEEILSTKGYILQEFSDTSSGIPDVVSGVHDIKLITIGEHVFANLRTPEEGDVCTFDSPYTEVQVSKLPQEVLDFHRKVKEKVNEKFPGQLYTIDIGVTDKGPIVFELNPHTAFPYISFEYAQDFFNALIAHLQNM